MTDAEKIYDFCDEMWERQIIPQLTEYIKIPAGSPTPSTSSGNTTAT